jgi:hypothetical protein
MNRIKIKREWSGVQVLQRTYPLYPINVAKDSLNSREFDIWRPGLLGVVKFASSFLNIRSIKLERYTS